MRSYLNGRGLSASLTEVDYTKLIEQKQEEIIDLVAASNVSNDKTATAEYSELIRQKQIELGRLVHSDNAKKGKAGSISAATKNKDKNELREFRQFLT